MDFGSSLTSTVLGMATALLALSLFVQVLQEIYKYLTSSKARLYTMVLEDFLGPWAVRLRRPEILPDFQARGPFQIRRLSPRGVLIPLAKDDLIEGLERTAAPWHRQALRALRMESEIQEGHPAPASPELERFVTDLSTATGGDSGTGGLNELWGFLEDHRLAERPPPPDKDSLPHPGEDAQASLTPKPFSAESTLRAFRERFFSHVIDAEKHFGRLETLVDYEYRRRNLRQSFVLGFGVALLLAQPVQAILERAKLLSPEEAAAAAEQVVGLYQAQNEALTGGDTTPDQATQVLSPEELQAALTRAYEALGIVQVEVPEEGQEPDLLGQLRANLARLTDFNFVLGCLVTAVLLSFGAPLWNDIVGTITRVARPIAPSPRQPPPQQPSAPGGQ